MLLAADMTYEVGDRVKRQVCGEWEFGTVTEIPDGLVIEEVVVLTEDDQAEGYYTPEEWELVK